jgi:hypothetical protein
VAKLGKIGFNLLFNSCAVSGLLDLTYYALSAEILVTIATWLEIATMLSAIVATLCILVATFKYPIEELRRIIEYAQSRPPKGNKNRKNTNINNQKPRENNL